MRMFHQFLCDLKGATAVEYGLIAAIMSVALISGYGAFTNSLTGTLNIINTNLADANAKMD